MSLEQPQNWKDYRAAEVAHIMKALAPLGYTLESDQPHIKGERFLMKAATTAGGQKVILLGQDQSGNRVVIKGSSDSAGQHEIEHERTCRQVINQIDFAYTTFQAPQEVYYKKTDDLTISIQTYLEQTSAFLERPLAEQFTYALNALKQQECAHATTYKHVKKIEETFGRLEVADYLENAARFANEINSGLEANLMREDLLRLTLERLAASKLRITQYCNFLTHTDFVPHNFRIHNNTLYLLDFSSLRFGNKHEGWARFINFMTLYNPELQRALEQYVRDNRAVEEIESLHLMRLYRLLEIIWYYTNKLPQSTGDLKTLNRTRVDFWSTVLNCVYHHQEVPEDILKIYTTSRDQLRSTEEKERQINLH